MRSLSKIAIAILLALVAAFGVRFYRNHVSSNPTTDDINEALEKQQESTDVHDSEHRLAPLPPASAPPPAPEAPTTAAAVQTASNAYGSKLDEAKKKVEDRLEGLLQELSIPNRQKLKCEGARCAFKIQIDPANEQAKQELVQKAGAVIGDIATEYGKMVKSGDSHSSQPDTVDFKIEFYDSDAEADATHRDQKEGQNATQSLFTPEGLSTYKDSTGDKIEGQDGDKLGSVAGYIFDEGKKQGRLVKADHVRIQCPKPAHCRLELAFPADATPDLANADTWAYKSLLTQGAPALGVNAQVTAVNPKLQDGITFLNIAASSR